MKETPEKQTVKFGDICREVKLTTKDPLADGYDKYIGLEHLDSGSLKIKRWGSVSEDNPSFTRVFKKGQILFGKRRPYLKKAAIAEFDGICSGDIIVMEANSDVIIPLLLPFIIQSRSFWSWAIQTSSGSLSPRTKWKSLALFELNLPSQKEQKILFSLCDKYFQVNECVDDITISSNELTKSLEVKLFTKGVSLSPKTQKHRFGDFPDDWRLEKLESIAKVTDGAHHTPKYIDAGVPFLRVTDIQDEQIDLSCVKYISEDEHHELCKRCMPEKGDILLSKNGTIGITKMVDWNWDFSIFVSLCLIKVFSDDVDREYLNLVLSSELIKHQIRSRSKTGTITNLHLEEIRDFTIPVPPIEEQKQIVKVLKNMGLTKKVIGAKHKHLVEVYEAISSKFIWDK